MRLLTVQAVVGAMALVATLYASAATAQLPVTSNKLGLYDAQGYPYYPVEAQVFGVMRKQTDLLATRGAQIESHPERTAARTRSANPRVQVSRHPAAATFERFPGPVRQRPMPLPDSMIMDPWAVGVFR